MKEQLRIRAAVCSKQEEALHRLTFENHSLVQQIIQLQHTHLQPTQPNQPTQPASHHLSAAAATATAYSISARAAMGVRDKSGGVVSSHSFRLSRRLPDACPSLVSSSHLSLCLSLPASTPTRPTRRPSVLQRWVGARHGSRTTLTSIPAAAMACTRMRGRVRSRCQRAGRSVASTIGPLGPPCCCSQRCMLSRLWTSIRSRRVRSGRWGHWRLTQSHRKLSSPPRLSRPALACSHN